MFAYVLILGSKIRKKVSVKLLKKFVVEKHVPTQKYKLLGEDFPQECIVLLIADTEDELNRLIEKQRIRPPVAKFLQSATETTDEEIQPSYYKRKAAYTSNVGAALKKRLANLERKSGAEKDPTDSVLAEWNSGAESLKTLEKETAPQSNLQNCFQQRISNKENFKQPASQTGRIEELRVCKKCEIMERNITQLKAKCESLSGENETLGGELILKDEELMTTKAVVQILEDDNHKKLLELDNLRSLNMDWQKIAMEKHSKLLDVHRATMEAPTSDGGGKFPAIGFITEDGAQIHIGRGLYLSTQAWYLALNVPMSRKITFARNILVALCGYDYLSRATVSGKGSNRNQQRKKPEHRLDPKILLAIKDVYSYYLVTEKNFKKDDADVEASKIHSTISKKIAEVKNAKNKAYASKPERSVMGCSSLENSENDEDIIDVGNGQRVNIAALELSDLIDAPEDDDPLPANDLEDRLHSTDPERSVMGCSSLENSENAEINVLNNDEDIIDVGNGQRVNIAALEFAELIDVPENDDSLPADDLEDRLPSTDPLQVTEKDENLLRILKGQGDQNLMHQVDSNHDSKEE